VPLLRRRLLLINHTNSNQTTTTTTITTIITTTGSQSAMAGQVQFKADRFGMVHVGVGKVDFPLPALLENVRVLMVRVVVVVVVVVRRCMRQGQ
jgi:ribosomal protein L1